MNWVDLPNLLVSGSWGQKLAKSKRFDRERVLLERRDTCWEKVKNSEPAAISGAKSEFL